MKEKEAKLNRRKNIRTQQPQFISEKYFMMPLLMEQSIFNERDGLLLMGMDIEKPDRIIIMGSRKEAILISSKCFISYNHFVE